MRAAVGAGPGSRHRPFYEGLENPGAGHGGDSGRILQQAGYYDSTTSPKP